ncbi:uncharacterized protein BO96DRAFT_430360 [Aspergillus niger CBS 101883]|uniref:uncharacterized protein n=1 Tax=Aspergillus lacticoffeatus (strain CBS 101883) TaxID=1450533 RepID=UPI000D803ADE|nr:uncharacterized protein BO96DRAFT_430360 [Aspergillus niger CBS 101883]PYH60423.1 hypothetical protein BO96DRAFT_430360 [Aspergillus niger CBS 101883]
MVGKTERLAEKIASTAWQSCRLPADRDKVLSIRAGPFSRSEVVALVNQSYYSPPEKTIVAIVILSVEPAAKIALLSTIGGHLDESLPLALPMLGRYRQEDSGCEPGRSGRSGVGLWENGYVAFGSKCLGYCGLRVHTEESKQALAKRIHPLLDLAFRESNGDFLI